MQPETPETFPTVFSQDSPHPSTPPSQYGSQQDSFGSPSLSQLEEHGGNTTGSHETGSEWSMSTPSSPSEDDTWLNPLEAFLSQSALFDDDPDLNSATQRDGDGPLNRLKALRDAARTKSPILQCPHEVLLQMLSHLPATDLLTVKLVSRRFQDLVNTPHVWISAFSKHFPGPSALRTSRVSVENVQIVATERRCFTRLSPVASWTSEYLLRTKLLRCLARGRPSLPFAAPVQGKPNKGFATFSFYSRLRVVTSLDAKFGPVNDKRLPQFMHGCSGRGTVSISDRRGELSGWGLTENLNIFQSFEETYPGTAMWGAGRGEIVGVPNVMEVSSVHGMACGEGFPGGQAFFLAANEKHTRILAPLLGTAHHNLGIPRILQSSNAFCCAWIAKTLSVPRQTKGIVGMLFGSSNGLVSAFSLGMPGGRGQRLERGELTARWLLSPGVPIIAIQVDENLSSGRLARGRVWAIALNALGEVFYIRGFPKQPSRANDQVLAPEVASELRSWQTGFSAPWKLVEPTIRSHRPSYYEDQEPPSYFLGTVWPQSHEAPDLSSQMRSAESWLLKTPADMKGRFYGWDMRQRLEVDFAASDDSGAGEAVVVFRCGHEELEDDGGENVTMSRYTRCSMPEMSSSVDQSLTASTNEETETPFEWRASNLVLGRSNTSKITTTTIDSSLYALTTLEDDVALWHVRLAQMDSHPKTQPSGSADRSTMPKIPGQRARFIAAGTSTGYIYMWDARSSVPLSSNTRNEVLPLRVIHTSSPEISSLALSALYLVHGGSEGLVQAWDPLCSTNQPIRTICSALSRRALVAAQQDPNFASRNASAVGAICLDPDPGLLRGIVALRGNLRYWSYSSSSVNKDLSKSQKRRLHRATRGIKSNTSDGFTGARRVDLKGFVSQEMVARGIDEQDKKAEEKKNKRINGRFGVDLLGTDASEEEMIAYARLLSEEEHERQMQRSAEKRLPKDASEAEVQAHISSLSAEDYEKWKYASWEERLHIPASEPSTVTRTTPASTPIRGQAPEDHDLERALRISMQATPSAFASASARVPVPEVSEEKDVAEAIRRSLGYEGASSIEEESAPADADDDMAEAIRLSLQEQHGAASPPPSSTSSGLRSHSLSATDEDNFPALASSPTNTPPSGVWGRGKRRA